MLKMIKEMLCFEPVWNFFRNIIFVRCSWLRVTSSIKVDCHTWCQYFTYILNTLACTSSLFTVGNSTEVTYVKVPFTDQKLFDFEKCVILSFLLYIRINIPITETLWWICEMLDKTGYWFLCKIYRHLKIGYHLKCSNIFQLNGSVAAVPKLWSPKKCKFKTLLDVPYTMLIWFSCITLTPQWARWRLKSPASQSFTQTFIQTQIKVNIKAPRHWPLCGEFTGTGEFPAQRANYAENVAMWWRHHGRLMLPVKSEVWCRCDAT